MKELRDRVAVVTGAASGVGKALAKALLGEGMKVVLADVEEPPPRRPPGSSGPWASCRRS
jgi:NAD(P)-dependent dehydrogenase (short-subunit alcohol dehydrogenase family)